MSDKFLPFPLSSNPLIKATRLQGSKLASIFANENSGGAQTEEERREEAAEEYKKKKKEQADYVSPETQERRKALDEAREKRREAISKLEKPFTKKLGRTAEKKTPGEGNYPIDALPEMVPDADKIPEQTSFERSIYPMLYPFDLIFDNLVVLSELALSAGKCISTSDVLSKELEDVAAKLEPSGYGPYCALTKDVGQSDAIKLASWYYKVSADTFYRTAGLGLEAYETINALQSSLIYEINSSFDLTKPHLRGYQGMAEPLPKSVYKRNPLKNLELVEIFDQTLSQNTPYTNQVAAPERRDEEDEDPTNSSNKIEDPLIAVQVCSQTVPELKRKEPEDPNKENQTESATSGTQGGQGQQEESDDPENLPKLYIPNEVGSRFQFKEKRTVVPIICSSCMVTGSKTFTDRDTQKINSSGFIKEQPQNEEDPVNLLETINSRPVEESATDGTPYVYGKMIVPGRLTTVLQDEKDPCLLTGRITVEFKLAANPLLSILSFIVDGVIIDDTILSDVTYSLENRADGAYAIVAGLPYGYLTVDGKSAGFLFEVIELQAYQPTNTANIELIYDSGIHGNISKFTINPFEAKGYILPENVTDYIYTIDLRSKVTGEQPTNEITKQSLISFTGCNATSLGDVKDMSVSNEGNVFLLHTNGLTLIDRFNRTRCISDTNITTSRIRNKIVSGRDRIDITSDMPYHYDLRDPSHINPAHYLPGRNRTYVDAGAVFIAKDRMTSVLLFPSSYIFWGHHKISLRYHLGDLSKFRSSEILYVRGYQHVGGSLNSRAVQSEHIIVSLNTTGNRIKVVVLTDEFNPVEGYSGATESLSEPHEYGVKTLTTSITTPGVFHSPEDVDIFVSPLYSNIVLANKKHGFWITDLKKLSSLSYENTGSSSIIAEKITNAPSMLTSHTFDPSGVGKMIFYISVDKKIVRLDTMTRTWIELASIDDTADPIDVAQPIWTTNGGRSSQRPEIFFTGVSGNLYKIKPYDLSFSTDLSLMVSRMLTDQDIAHEILDTVTDTDVLGFAITNDTDENIPNLAKHLFHLTNLSIVNAGGVLYLTSKLKNSGFGSSASELSKTETENLNKTLTFSVIDDGLKSRVITDQNPRDGKPPQDEYSAVFTNILVRDYENMGKLTEKVISAVEYTSSYQVGLKQYSRGIYDIDLISNIYTARGAASDV